MANLIDIDDHDEPTQSTIPPHAEFTQKLTNLLGQDLSGLSQDEAMSLAIQATELSMKLMQLAKNKDEKLIHKANSSRLLTQAEKIKNIQDWNSDVRGALMSLQPLQPVNSSTLNATASPFSKVKTPPARTASSTPRPAAATPTSETAVVPPPPTEDIVVLKEPKYCRKISRTEEIILWKGARVRNGPFPPWSDNSGKTIDHPDFTLGPHFVEEHTLPLPSQHFEILAGWRSPEEALPPPHMRAYHGRGSPIMSSDAPTDFVQDASTDCSVVASMCASMARVEKGFPALLSNIFFPFDETTKAPLISPNGKYNVRLNFNGCFRKVHIDDRLPVTINDRLLHVIDRNNPRLLWPPLLEKAYLKIRGGYDFPGSNSGTDLWILTGWLPEHVFLHLEQTDVARTWQRMYQAFQYGDVLVTIGTGRLSRRVEKRIGLVREHDYAVLDMKESEHGRKQVLVKNPWLNAQAWQGRYGRRNSESMSSISDSSSSEAEPPLVNVTSGQPKSTRKQQHTSVPPGSFWMSFSDVVQHFESLYLNWNPGLFKYRADMHFEWDLSKERSPLNSLRTNPQFNLQAGMDDQVWIILSRHFPTMDDSGNHWPADAAQREESFISLYTFQNNGQCVIASRNAYTSSPFVDTPQTLLKIDARANEPITLVPAQQDLHAASHVFTLSVFTQQMVQIDRAKPRYADSASLSGRWTEETAGGNAKCPLYTHNPQYSLHLPSQSRLSICVESAAEDLSINVKLVHGKGRRIETDLKTQDIILESGEYRRHCVVASTSKAYADNQLESQSARENENYIPAGTYTLIVSTFDPGQTGAFTLTVASNVNASLNAIPRSGAGRILRRFADVSFAPGVRRVAAPFTVSRLVTVYFIVKAVQRPHPTSEDDAYGPASGAMPPSPVRLTVDSGLGPNRTMVIASGDGAFMDATGAGGVRTEDVQMAPARKANKHAVSAGAAASNEMWLVLERMGLDLRKGEERFQVESWGDVPEWENLGVWREVG